MDILAVSLWGVFTMPLCKTDFKVCYDAMMKTPHVYIFILDVAISAAKEELSLP